MYGRLRNRRQIDANGRLKHLLQKHHDRKTGYEAALGELQDEYARSRSPNTAAEIRAFQDAIVEVLDDFHASLRRQHDIEWTNERSLRVTTFLTYFDEIYSLNHDLLPDLYYFDHVQLASNARWGGSQMPGMSPNPDKTWTPKETYEVRPRLQPFYKLHGGTNWNSGENRMLVMGYNKHSTIGSNAVLKKYHETFSKSLEQHDTLLVVIGYSFSDDHINFAIRQRFGKDNLRLFIVDPLGTDATVPPLNRRGVGVSVPNEYLDMIIGYSQRNLSETFGGRDTSELANVMRCMGLELR